MRGVRPKLMDFEFKCTICGKIHRGMPSFGVSHKEKMLKLPTFDEFRQCVFKKYDAIISSYSFVEHPLPDREFINKFQVRLANPTTLIIIEGINYGMAAWTRVCKFPQPPEKDNDLPIWRYISERRGESWPPRRTSKKRKEFGQLEQIEEQAKKLRKRKLRRKGANSVHPVQPSTKLMLLPPKLVKHLRETSIKKSLQS